MSDSKQSNDNIGQRNIIWLLFGVCGAGKTTLGSALARQQNIDFVEGDDFHNDVNHNKLSQGKPLTDDDRLPWLQAINRYLHKFYSTKPAVVSCSALTPLYRQIISKGLRQRMVFVLVKTPADILQLRVTQRQHFASPHLLDSQLQTLRIDANHERGVAVDGTEPLQKNIAKLQRWYQQAGDDNSSHDLVDKVVRQVESSQRYGVPIHKAP